MPSFIVKKELLWDGKRYIRGNILEIPEGNKRIEGLKIAGIIEYNAGSTAAEAPERAGTPREQPQQAPLDLSEVAVAVKPEPEKKRTTRRNKSKSRAKR